MTNRATGITRTPRDETLEILRRIEPVLDGIQNQLGRLDHRVENLGQRVEKLDQRVGAVENEVRETKTRVSLLPTVWQMIGPLSAIVFTALGSAGALVVLIRFAAGGP
jgi:archaellum component FlaC